MQLPVICSVSGKTLFNLTLKQMKASQNGDLFMAKVSIFLGAVLFTRFFHMVFADSL